MQDDISEISYPKKSEIEFERNSPIKSALASESKVEDRSDVKSKSNFLEFLDTIDEKSNQDILSKQMESPQKSSPKSNLDKMLKISEKMGTPSFKENPADKSHLISMEVELQECYSTITALKDSKHIQESRHEQQIEKLKKEFTEEIKKEKLVYEQEKEKHITLVEQLVLQKKQILEKLEDTEKEKYD